MLLFYSNVTHCFQLLFWPFWIHLVSPEVLHSPLQYGQSSIYKTAATQLITAFLYFRYDCNRTLHDTKKCHKLPHYIYGQEFLKMSKLHSVVTTHWRRTKQQHVLQYDTPHNFAVTHRATKTAGSNKFSSSSCSLRPRTFLLLLVKSKQRHARHFHHLESYARNISNRVTLAAKTSDKNFVVFLRKNSNNYERQIILNALSNVQNNRFHLNLYTPSRYSCHNVDRPESIYTTAMCSLL